MSIVRTAVTAAVLALCVAAGAFAQAQPPYTVWTTHSLAKLTTESQPDGPVDLRVALAMARREYEGFQIAIRAGVEHPLRAVRVRSSDLTGSGHVIPAENVVPFLVGYVLQRNRNVPDMLLPYPSAGFDAEVNATFAVYVQVHAPADAPAGRYTGTVSVEFGNAPPATVTIGATVYDFELPVGPGHCRTSFALQGDRRFEPGTYEQYADFMLEHRLNPDDIYRHQPPPVALLERWYEHGLNSFTIKKVAKGWPIDPIRTFLDELSASKYARELRNLAMVYGYDEKGAETWPAMAECFAQLKAEFPDIETSTTAHVYMEWPPDNDPVAVMEAHHIDIVAPWVHPGYPTYYRFDEGEKVRAAGRQLWAYNINFQTHYPLIDARATWWQMFHQKADGWLYYCVNGWADDAAPIDPEAGPFVAYTPKTPNSQGELMYRGTTGPIGSLRLAAIRDGIEDYEYLLLLREKIGEPAARELGAQVAWGILQWTSEPAKLFQVREQIARRIVESASR